MSPLPAWMRVTLFATAAMNLIGAIAFIPAASVLRVPGGLPDPDHPLYISTVAIFIFGMGLAYLGCALRGSADPVFIASAAFGKLAFFALLVGLHISGQLPIQAPLSGVGDLVFGILFTLWIIRSLRRA